MFLRSDDKKKWDELDKAISKKLGRNYLGLVKKKDLSKVKEIFESKLQAIREELTKRIEPSMTILKDAASSAVKPRESGKKLTRNLYGLIKAEDIRSVRERLKDNAKEQVERENGTTEEDEGLEQTSTEDETQTPVETPAPDGMPPEEVIPEEGLIEEEPGQAPTLDDDSAGEQPLSEAAPEQPITPEEQALEGAEVGELPEELGQLEGAVPEEGALPEGQMKPGEEMQPGEEMVPEEGMQTEEEMLPEDQIPEEGMEGTEEGMPPAGMQPGAEEGMLPEQGLPEQRGMHLAEPDPTLAQANNGEDQAKLLALQDELGRLQSSLQEIQGLSQEQGLLTEEELENIIIPLLQETENLKEMMQSQEDYRQSSLQQYGPRNQSGDISRELTEPTSNFHQNTPTGNLSKNKIDSLRDGASILNQSNLKKGGPGSGRKPEGGAKKDTSRTASFRQQPRIKELKSKKPTIRRRIADKLGILKPQTADDRQHIAFSELYLRMKFPDNVRTREDADAYLGTHHRKNSLNGNIDKGGPGSGPRRGPIGWKGRNTPDKKPGSVFSSGRARTGAATGRLVGGVAGAVAGAPTIGIVPGFLGGTAVGHAAGQGIGSGLEALARRTARRAKETKKYLTGNLLKEEGKGWHGDSQGHAEAARARWGGAGSDMPKEGSAVKPETKKPVAAVVAFAGSIAREMGQDTTRALKRAGRGIADTVGDTVADYGGEAVVAGMTAYLVASLKGEKRSLKAYMGDMKSEVLNRIQEVKDWKVVRRLSRSNEAKLLRTLSNRARNIAGKAGATRAGQLSGRTLRFAFSAAKHNPRVAAALFVASAIGAEGARRVGAKVKPIKRAKSKKASKKK